MSKIVNDKTMKASVITGDFNIDLIQYAQHSDTADFLNTMLQNSFLHAVLLPTRITDHSATLNGRIYLYEKQFHGYYVSGQGFQVIYLQIHPRQPLKPEVKFTESLVYKPIQFIWEKIF